MIEIKVKQLPASYNKVEEFLEVDITLELLNLIPKFETKEKEQLKRILENKILRGDKKVIVKLLKAYEDKLNLYKSVLEGHKEVWGKYEDTREYLDKLKEENKRLYFNREFLEEYKNIKDYEEMLDSKVNEIIIDYMEIKDLIEEQLTIVQYFWLALFSEVERKVILKNK